MNDFALSDFTTKLDRYQKERRQTQRIRWNIKACAVTFRRIMYNHSCDSKETAGLLYLGAWNTPLSLNSFFLNQADREETLTN